MKKIFQIIFLITIHYSLFALNTDSSKQLKFDTTYIRSYPDYLSIALFNNLPIISFRISSLNNQGPKILTTYKSNINNLIGPDIDYKGISLTYGFKAAKNINETTLKGESKIKFLNVKLHRHRYYGNISYMHCKGFYDETSFRNFPGYTEQHPYIIRPDMTFKKLNIYVLYNINFKKYSYLAPLSYTERQVKSKGGWLVAGGLYYYAIKDSGALGNILLNQEPKNVNDTLSKSLKTYFAKVGFGRGINLIISKRVFFNFQTLVSGNLAFQNSKSEKGSKLYVSPNVFLEFSSAIGYNSKRFFCGLRLTANRNVFRRQELRYTNALGSLQLNLGYRFNAPKWLDNGYDAVKYKILKLKKSKED